MKPLTFITTVISLVGIMLTGAPQGSLAQDVAKVAPNNVKVLMENEHVRVLDIHIKAGEKLPMHSHPAYVLYAFDPGKTKSTTPDGKTEAQEFKAGEARWNDGQTHATENTGTAESHVLLVEMKGTHKK